MNECEWCGQPPTRQDPTFPYFRVPKWFHTRCFEAYASEILAS